MTCETSVCVCESKVKHKPETLNCKTYLVRKNCIIKVKTTYSLGKSLRLTSLKQLNRSHCKSNSKLRSNFHLKESMICGELCKK